MQERTSTREMKRLAEDTVARLEEELREHKEQVNKLSTELEEERKIATQSHTKLDTLLLKLVSSHSVFLTLSYTGSI